MRALSTFRLCAVGHDDIDAKTKKESAKKRFAIGSKPRVRTGVGYEEDCDWAFVAVTFPDAFKAEVVEIARKIVGSAS